MKTNLIVIASILALGRLQAQSAPATPAAPAAPASSTTSAAPAASTATVAPSAPATTAAPAPSALPPLTINITTNDSTSFSVSKIEAHPGQTITVHLKNNGSMPKSVMTHNWILLKSGVNLNAYAAAAAAAASEDFQPKALNNEVIASIPMLGATESAEVTFTCPTTPGNYYYLCSCYGHAMEGMKGVLIVK